MKKWWMLGLCLVLTAAACAPAAPAKFNYSVEEGKLKLEVVVTDLMARGQYKMCLVGVKGRAGNDLLPAKQGEAGLYEFQTGFADPIGKLSYGGVVENLKPGDYDVKFILKDVKKGDKVVAERDNIKFKIEPPPPPPPPPPPAEPAPAAPDAPAPANAAPAGK